LTLLGNLEELEGVLVNAGALAVARCKVIQNRALVRIGPGVPLEGDLATGRDSRVQLGVGGASVARDIGASKGVGGNESKVGSSVGPRDTVL
jgi:hypothetical protein